MSMIPTVLLVQVAPIMKSGTRSRQDRRKIDAQKNQTMGLSEPMVLIVYKIHNMRTKENGFEEWHRAIMDVERTLKLQNLVESNIAP